MYWPPDNECTVMRRAAVTIEAIPVSDMMGSFFVLGLGVVLAILLFIWEIITGQKHGEKSEKGGKSFTP